jgi:CheY-like chemotaxis protein
MRVLVVEDEALMAYDLSDQLTEAGFTVVGPALEAAQALELLAREGCDVAVLDVNLGNGTTSEPIALELKRRAIPFIVASGYSRDQHPSAAFLGAPQLMKPIRVAVLLLELRKLIP